MMFTVLTVWMLPMETQSIKIKTSPKQQPIAVSVIQTLLTEELTSSKTVKIQGWVRTRRDSKAGLSFIAVSDGSGFSPIQVIAEQTLANYQDEILKLTKDCAVVVQGELVPSQGQGQCVEIKAHNIEVIGWVENPDQYPVSAKRHTMEFLREVPHLRVRTNTISAVARLRNTVNFAIHRFFNDKGFAWVNTPIITANDCEGAGELFRVSTLDQLNAEDKQNFDQDFFKQETFLTVSGQLNVESYCMALSKVYTFGPTFRAENSNTSRHLAEFWMLEPEIAFADLEADAQLAQELLQYVIQVVLDERQDDMAFFNQWVDKGVIERLQKVCQKPFVRMDYSEAIDVLQKSGQNFEYPVKWGLDLQSEHERFLCEQYVEGPVVVMNYPKEIKAFYMRLNDDGKTVAAMDVLVPGVGELIGGSHREERLDVLTLRFEEAGVSAEDFNWYIDLRRYGSVPHAGFGLGFERLLGYLSGVSNVRDLIPFPRTPGNAKI